jgi:hypothetical protein
MRRALPKRYVCAVVVLVLCMCSFVVVALLLRLRWVAIVV